MSKIDHMPSGLVAIDVSVDGDVEKELGLDKRPGAMTTLCYIADQGGEVRFSWEGAPDPATGIWRPLSPAARELVADLINWQLVREREYVGARSSQTTLVLTDKGRNVVTVHRARKVKIGGARDMSIAELAEMAKDTIKH